MRIERIRGELVSFNTNKKEVTIVNLEEIAREPCSARTHTYSFADELLIPFFQKARGKDADFIVKDGIVTTVTFP